MATPKEEMNELRSAISQLTDAVLDAATASREAESASRNAAQADREEAAASKSAAQGSIKNVANGLFNVGTAAVGVVNAMYGLGKVIASIGEDGRKFAEKVGTTASKGAQFQMDINKLLLSEVKKFGADQAVIMEQVKGAYSSFADTFMGAANGMQVSAKGTADFARSLNTGFKSEFTLTAAAMRGLITVGLSSTKQFEAFRKASGLAGVSTAAFTNLVNKNTLSFMLYGPAFAKAARDAERLGISLATVQKAQESLVTNLDSTIDTVAQINQLGGQVDFGTLVTLAETQGPEATLRYLQKTIPPNLFQSASTRALVSKLGIPLEALLQRQGSVQETAANQIEKAMTEQAREASNAATQLAGFNKKIQAIDNAKLMDLMNAAVSVITSFKNLGTQIINLGLSALAATAKLWTLALGPKGKPGMMVAPATTGGGAAAGASAAATMRNTGLVDQFGNPIMVPNTTPVPPSAAPKAGLLSKIKGSMGSFFGDDIVRGVSTARGGVAASSTLKVLNTGAKGLGPVGGILSAGTGGYMGYQQGKEMGYTTAQSAGMGTMRGGSAVSGGMIGAAIGTAIAPGIGTAIGAGLGALFGDIIGGAINKYFPELGASLATIFADIKAEVEPLLEVLKEMWGNIKTLGSVIGTIATPFIKVLAVVVGTLLTGAFHLLGTAIKGLIRIATYVMAFISGMVKIVGVVITSIWNGLLDIIKALIPGTFGDDKIDSMKIKETPKTGDDVVASAGYGRRTLVTPSGAIALNNRDTVIAYADDMMSGIQTYSLGTLSRRMGDPGLSGEVRELINTLRTATTNIQIDNKIQQVSRLGLANVGVYTRNERV